MGRDGRKIGLGLQVFFVVTAATGAGYLGLLMIQSYSQFVETWYFQAGVLFFSALAAGLAAFLLVREQQKLTKHYGELQAITASLPSSCFILDGRGSYCRVMTRREDRLSVRNEELVESNVREQLPSETAEECMEAIEQALETGEIQEVEYSLPGPAGPRYYSSLVSPLNQNQVVFLARDITGQKEREKQLEVANRELESKNRELEAKKQQLRQEVNQRQQVEEDLKLTKFTMENASVGVFRITPGGKFEYVNKRAAEMMGYTRDELTGKEVEDIEVGHTEELRNERWQRIKEDEFDHIETQVETSDGDRFSVEVISRYLEYEGHEYEFAFARDISDRKQREDRIKVFKQAFDTSRSGLAIIVEDAAGRGIIEYVNESGARMHGYEPGELMGKSIKTVHPEEEHEKLQESFEQLEQEGSWSGELKRQRKDGSTFPSLATSTLFRTDSGDKKYIGITRDITERKEREKELQDLSQRLRKELEKREHVEEELRKSEKKYRRLVETTGDIILIHDYDGKVEFINQAGLDFTGYTENEFKGKKVTDFLPEDELPALRKRRQKRLEEENTERFKYETALINKDGERIDVNIESTPIIAEEEIKGMLVVARDITELKEKEEKLLSLNQQLAAYNQELEAKEQKLRESEQKFRGVYEHSPIGIVLYDQEGNFLEANEACLEIFGIEEFEQLSDFRLFDNPNLPNYAEEKLKRGETVEYETELVFSRVEELDLYDTTRSGTIHIKAQVTPFEVEAESNLPGYLAQVQEITERKEKEQQLRENREFLDQVLETSPVGIVVFDRDGKITQVNERFLEVFNLTRSEALGRSYDEESWGFVDENGESLSGEDLPFDRVLTEVEDIYNLELGIRRSDGKRAWLSTSLAPVFGEGDRIKRVVGAVEDITRRRQMEAEIRESLEEKEVMLQEIHHRVKNNLQVICSLLDMRSWSAIPEAKKPLIETRNRVNSMALIHERIYHSDSPAAVNIKDYLEELAAGLKNTYDIDQQEIQVQLDVEKTISFQLDTAVPCALVLNELLANAFDHAFPDRSEAENIVQISFQESSSEFDCCLRISDNGQGLPEGYEIGEIGHQDTLGLGLVKSLVEKQLSGRLEANSNPGEGTEFIVEF